MIMMRSVEMMHRLCNSVKALHGLRRSRSRSIPFIRTQVRSRGQSTEKFSSFFPPMKTQVYDCLPSRLSAFRADQLQPGLSCKNWAPSRIRAFSNSGRTNPNLSESEKGRGIFGSLIKSLAKLAGGLLVAAVLIAASLPYLLSSPKTREVAIALANRSIPGSISVSSMSLGWTRPISVEGLAIQGADSEEVLLIRKLETKASLWSIVSGRSGLGDCTITSLTLDLQSNPENDLPRLALALQPAEKYIQNRSRAGKKVKRDKIAPAESSLTLQVKAPKGGLEIASGKLILPGDLAAVIGNKLLVNIDLGFFATKENDELKVVRDGNEGVPVVAKLWSECAQLEGVGFLQMKKSKVKLIKPLRAEMDLTPAVAKFYLAGLNPLLGKILGPAVQDDDMPDIIVEVTPTNLELPSNHYKIKLEPFKATLARDQVVDGILSLLSKQELAKGKRSLTMQTSVIETEVDMPGSLECARIDILIADRIHVATWGHMDWIEETVKMTLAIPGHSLRDVLGLSKVPSSYYLKIPVSGTFGNPSVDWKVAGIGIAQLTARQRGGQLMGSFMDIFDANERPDVPDPTGTFPWTASKAK